MEKLVALHGSAGIHNANFVTPDHFLPHTVAVVEALRRRGIRIPVLYNLSGYQSLESLRLIEPVADIYLPDFKYADPALAGSLSRCPDYAAVALEALVEMVRQKGFLDTLLFGGDHEVHGMDRNGARPVTGKSVLVRHLVLPGQVENSRQVLDMLYVEFGRDLPLSLMSQYVPIREFPEAPVLNRTVTAGEFRQVLEHAGRLGFSNLFVQYPEGTVRACTHFCPTSAQPHPSSETYENLTPSALRRKERSSPGCASTRSVREPLPPPQAGAPPQGEP